MGKTKKVIGTLLWLVLLISVCAVACRWYFDCDFFGNDKEHEESVPDGVPTVIWDDSSPEKSYKELSALLSDLEPVIAVTNNSKNLQWEDVCRENFWVESFSITGVSGGNIKTYKFRFKSDASDNKTMQAEIEKEAKEIISLVPSDADDYEKALILHDELVKRITYDESAELKHSHDIYGAFVEHRAVCQGYTYAMTYLAKRVDLKCEELVSATHIWNKLTGFDSGECYIDITWDDTDKVDAEGKPYVIHDNFGLLKDEMEKLSEHQPDEPEKDTALSNSVGDNYFRRNGWYIPKGDAAALEFAVKEQLEGESNVIELRFEDSTDYSGARDNVDAMLRRMGYRDGYISWMNEDLLIYTVGLNPSEEE